MLGIYPACFFFLNIQILLGQSRMITGKQKYQRFILCLGIWLQEIAHFCSAVNVRWAENCRETCFKTATMCGGFVKPLTSPLISSLKTFCTLERGKHVIFVPCRWKDRISSGFLKSQEDGSAYFMHSYQVLKINKASLGTLDMSRNSMWLIKVNGLRNTRPSEVRLFLHKHFFFLQC